MSLIEEDGEQRVRMAHLAIVGSHAVNGVAALHTEILKSRVFRDFHELWPDKFSNKTNGVTPAPLAAQEQPGPVPDSSPSAIGDALGHRPGRAEEARPPGRRPRTSPRRGGPPSGSRSSSWPRSSSGSTSGAASTLRVNPDSLFDVQVKRIHEYKRQLLNVLHVITLYNRITDRPQGDIVPRTVIFGGKAAPGLRTWPS